MTYIEKAKHILKVSGKEQGIKWAEKQIGKPVPKIMNPDNMNQQLIDAYWLCVIEEIKK